MTKTVTNTHSGLARTYAFPRGGINFEDPAAPFRSPAVIPYLPSLSVIPMIQHSGARAYPVVAVGDHVREGMLVGRGQGPGSANVHASVPGRVVRQVSWKMADGRANDGIVIRMEGAFERLGRKETLQPWTDLTPADLLRVIADCGVVEMEHPGRPITDLIAALRGETGPVTLVVRCVFDDPWLAADYAVAAERPNAVAEGAHAVALIARARRVLYAVSHREKDLAHRLLTAAADTAAPIPAAAVTVGSRYPQHNRRELELVLRAYEKRTAGNSAAANGANGDSDTAAAAGPLGRLLILTPSTLAAVYDAVALRRPLVERCVAVGGSAVRHPQVLRARLGSRIGELFEHCGGFESPPQRVAVGSPVQGYRVADLDEPVAKTTTAVFALKLKTLPHPARILEDCVSCGECRVVCPVGLDPEELYKRALIRTQYPPRPASDDNDIAGADEPDRAGECHGCGCCELVCPSALPLSRAITSGGRTL